MNEGNVEGRSQEEVDRHSKKQEEQTQDHCAAANKQAQSQLKSYAQKCATAMWVTEKHDDSNRHLSLNSDVKRY